MGTGYKVVQKIERVMKSRGEVEFEYLFLADANLKQCRGCFLCVSKGEDLCPIKEDREEIERRIEKADGIILVSPGYVQNVSGLMKNFIDRFAYTHHRPKFFEKKVLIVANGGAGLKKVLDALRIAIGGPEVVNELTYLMLPWPRDAKYERKSEKALLRVAGEFYDSLATKSVKPSFANYMQFRFFKAVSKDVKEWLPADYEFYKDKKVYYFDTRIPAVMKLKADILLKIGLLFAKGMGPESPGKGIRKQ
jgi:NAD(P)H-dependent FMN reductase